MEEAISTRVPAEVKRAAEAEAKRAGMSVSEWLRFELRKRTDTEPVALTEMETSDREAIAA